jgi:hypothetical protein
MLTSGCFSSVLTATLAWSPPAAFAEEGPVAFGLQDFRGTWHSHDEVRESRVVAIAFLGVECPLASPMPRGLPSKASGGRTNRDGREAPSVKR